MKKPMIKWLGIGLLCTMFSIAQATIQGDIDAGLPVADAIQNALAEGDSSAGEIAVALMSAGYEPAAAAKLVAAAAPGSAAEIAKAVVEALPDDATADNVADIAAAVTEIVPAAAAAIAQSVTAAKPFAAAKIAKAVRKKAPKSAAADIDDAVIAEAPEAAEDILAEDEDDSSETTETETAESETSDKESKIVVAQSSGTAAAAGTVNTGQTTADGKPILAGINAVEGVVTGAFFVATGENSFTVVTPAGVSTGVTVSGSDLINRPLVPASPSR